MLTNYIKYETRKKIYREAINSDFCGLSLGFQKGKESSMEVIWGRGQLKFAKYEHIIIGLWHGFS